MGAMEWMVMYIILLNITSNKGCGVWATTIECQNAFVSFQCCALCGGQNIRDYEWYKVQMHVLKVCSVHSVHSLWKSKRMATYMPSMAPLVACDYPLYKYKHVNIHLFQLRLLPWTVFHSLHCTMINSCSGKFSLVHVHWNNGDHLWKAFKRAFISQMAARILKH